MISTASDNKTRSIFIVILLLLLFLLPVVFAWIFYLERNIHGTANYGQLIRPPLNFEKIVLQSIDGVSLTPETFHGKWLLLYVNPQPICDETCQKTLYNLRQINLALGNKMHRVQRAILLFAGPAFDPKLKQLLENNYQATIPVVATKNQYQQIMAGLSSEQLALQQGYLYLVDPLGNIMMQYPLNAKPAGILKDLERLLRVSQIG